MNKYVKSFLQRGLIFAGFGPLVIGIIYLIKDLTANDLKISGIEVCIAIVTSYLLAFVHAGASVFNQIEEWSLLKSTTCHFWTLYFAYASCYLLNAWIPFKKEVLLIFSLIFILGYFVIWISVVVSIKLVSKRMNKRLLEMRK